MTWFSARNISTSVVPASAGEIWPVITDPATLANLTPLVRSIHAEGPHWRWRLDPVEGLGLGVEAVFTERMSFVEERSIVFDHEPPPGSRERAGVAGVYQLTPCRDGSTALKVDLTLSVDLPLPRIARPAVERTIESSMRMTGRRFAVNLYDTLGLDPASVSIEEGTR